MAFMASMAVLGHGCAETSDQGTLDGTNGQDIGVGFIDGGDGPAPQHDGPAPQHDGPSPQNDGPSPHNDGPSPQNDGPSPHNDGPSGACTENSQCSNWVCVAGQCSTQPLAEAFAGTATFVLDQSGLGQSYGLHFLSVLSDGQTYLDAYYIDNLQIDGIWRSRVGLATSADGVTFVKQGVALDLGGAWESVYQAGSDLQHATGGAHADGWEAVVGQHQPGHMIFGPYVSFLHPAAQLVSFRLLVDSTSDHTQVVNLDIYDATAQQVLAERAVHRDAFSAPQTYDIFTLAFTPVVGHQYEFRVYWLGNTYTRVSTVATATSTDPPWDNRLASFPGVLKDGSTWWLVYEGAGLSSAWPGDVGLVTSTDGAHFARTRAGPFLAHDVAGWEKVNIGTPSLFKQGNTFYLFYHGFDGVDVQIGLATFTPGGPATKHPQNPVLTTSTGGWDSGTVGKRSSILEEGGFYYMAYEGSTDQPFDTADWSSGLARSPDLLTWSKSPANPLIPTTQGGFGNDGPELVVFEGRYYLYVRGPGNSTTRYVLQGIP